MINLFLFLCFMWIMVVVFIIAHVILFAFRPVSKKTNWSQRKCKHVFRGPDIGRRDKTGWLDWSCSKCGKSFRFEYGLQAEDHGTITGPWGTNQEPKENRYEASSD